MKTLLPVLFLLISNAAIAQEDPLLAHDEQLHEDKCVSCHESEVYTREDRRVKTLDALSAQVNFCMKGAAKANWTVSETNAVIEYLNTRYYKF